MEAQLHFTVKNQIIRRIDKFDVVAKSINYLYAYFEFVTDDWKDKVKTAIFRNGKDGTPYTVLLEDDVCLVPHEVLSGDDYYIYVSVFAGNLITVNTAKVYVQESGYTEGETPVDPTPSVYDQIIERLEKIEASQSIEGLIEYIDHLLADVPHILYKTASEWDEDTDAVSEENVIYVYTDYISITISGQTVYYPGIKVGNGESLIVDLPFIGEYRLNQHIADTVMHITANERADWNNKVSVSTDSTDNKMLVFSTTL